MESVVDKNLFNSSNTSIFLSSQCDIFRREFSQETDVPLLGYGEDHLSVIDITESSQTHQSKLQRVFEQVELTGTKSTIDAQHVEAAIRASIMISMNRLA